MGAAPLAVLSRMRKEKGFGIVAEMDSAINRTEMFSPDVKPESVYSYLAMAGYLKTVRQNGLGPSKKPLCLFSMVNKEIASAFDSLAERAKRIGLASSSAMDAIYARDEMRSKDNIEALLAGFSMDKTWELKNDPSSRHDRYRDLIAAYLLTPEMAMSTGSPKGFGLTDIFYPASKGNPPVIIEVKSTIDPESDLCALARTALEQIEEKRYADGPDPKDAVPVGIGIRMKTVEVAFRRFHQSRLSLLFMMATAATAIATMAAKAIAIAMSAFPPRSASTLSPNPESSQDFASAFSQWTAASTFRNAVLSPEGAFPWA